MSGSKKSAQYDTQYIKDYQNYLRNYDTTNVDTTLNNLTDYARLSSQDLANVMGDYTFNVNASDEARRQAQDATYNQYMDRLNPQFERQTSDLQTRLANQGLSIGSEAYQRAMTDLQQEQNKATNQAAYQSVLAGQQAYAQDLANQINAGTFGNNAQQNYIKQLLSALEGSASGYENQQNLYAVGKALADANYQNDLAKKNAKSKWGSALGSAAGMAIGAYLGGPTAGVAGAKLGSKAGGQLGGAIF